MRETTPTRRQAEAGGQLRDDRELTDEIDARSEPTATKGPRLLSLRRAAAYMGVSFWTVRDWALAGYLPVVNLPPLRPRAGDRPRRRLRRVLLDQRDLDQFIEERKQRART